MKISLCIEPVFEDVKFEERVHMARICGADAIEFWDTCQHDMKALAKACEHENMPVAACSVVGSWDVRLNDVPERVLANMEETIRIGKDIGCTRFIGLSGDCDVGGKEQSRILISNLKSVAELAEKHGVVVLVEALNSLYDHKGYYLDHTFEASAIIRAVESPSVRLLYDVYHMQIMEGNLVNTIRDHADIIGHFHFAGVPGRHEPQYGEINYAAVSKAIEASAYDGYCGLEYWPVGRHEESVRVTIDCLRSCI